VNKTQNKTPAKKFWNEQKFEKLPIFTLQLACWIVYWDLLAFASQNIESNLKMSERTLPTTDHHYSEYQSVKVGLGLNWTVPLKCLPSKMCITY